jgi:hypothetical protein
MTGCNILYLDAGHAENSRYIYIASHTTERPTQQTYIYWHFSAKKERKKKKTEKRINR